MPKYVVIHEPAGGETEVRYFMSQVRAYRYLVSLPGQAKIAQVLDEKQEGE